MLCTREKYKKKITIVITHYTNRKTLPRGRLFLFFKTSQFFRLFAFYGLLLSDDGKS